MTFVRPLCVAIALIALPTGANAAPELEIAWDLSQTVDGRKVARLRVPPPPAGQPCRRTCNTGPFTSSSSWMAGRASACHHESVRCCD